MKGNAVTMHPIHLSPAQQHAYDGIMQAVPAGHLLSLSGGPGSGKTTVLRAVRRSLGGALLTIKDLIDAMRARHPLTIEETFAQIVMDALVAHDTVLLDDLDLVERVTMFNGMYPRTGLLAGPITTLTSYAAEAGKTLIAVGGEHGPGALRVRGYPFAIPPFTAADYAFLCTARLGAAAANRLDVEKIHRFAPNLNAYQIISSCDRLKLEERLDTPRFIDYLEEQHLISNVDLGEVQPVDLRDLKGIDDLVQNLEANVILPLENEELAAALDLKPKRGVLLAGPPGTGKTTVGRALAHRLKGRFFLIDGTFVSGTPEFFRRVHAVFEAAKQNTASILFIDDSDVIFENGGETGLYRYLLTMLDGLESKSAGRICVILTAMDVGNLPPALVRSGRIVWLETRLPDEAARRAILSDHLAAVASALGEVDLDQLGPATEGLTGADLKRLVDDGKLLFAYDKAQGRPLRPLAEYFLTAVERLRVNKERYAEAEARAQRLRPSRPPWFAPMAFAAMDEDAPMAMALPGELTWDQTNPL